MNNHKYFRSPLIVSLGTLELLSGFSEAATADKNLKVIVGQVHAQPFKVHKRRLFCIFIDSSTGINDSFD